MAFTIVSLAGHAGRAAVGAAAAYVVGTTTVAAGVAVLQEQKIWAPASLPSLPLFGLLKVFLFNVVWMIGCLLGSIMITAKWIVMFGQSDIAREGHLLVENLVARACIYGFVGKVQLKGMENLPDENMVPAPVFVANHASQIDVGAVYFLGRRFKWIAKSSVLYVPGVGQVMYLSKHVMINRRKGKNQKSVDNLFDKSDQAVQAGIPMFIFPQGTRRIAEKLPFKNGAFIIAQKNSSPLVPISIEIPTNAWKSWYPFQLLWTRDSPAVIITVHKPIPVTGKEDREALKKQCFDQIYSVLPPVIADDDSKAK
jgi:1-acyl-sn-glycerol-3-phosphate acyltransferase